ncbi:MAG: hypothetical protein IJ292_01490 [Clostridia bacterium]|nr:hypothetical protein [Clostridia bacterium]
MKKKTIIISAVVVTVIVVTIIVVAVIALTNMFTKGVIAGKLYRVDNVYEDIWNMVNSEKNGTRTILTTSIEGSEVVYDLGCFHQVSIPVNDEYRVALRFYQNEFCQDELCIWLFEKNSKSYDAACYVYNYQTNTLYGNQEEAHLIDKFTSLYYSWVGNDGKFNSENQGDYTFVLAEYPLSHK